MKLFKMNDFDYVAAVSEEQARTHYLEITGLPEDEAFDEGVYTELDPSKKHVILGKSEEEEIRLTFEQAYKEGHFTLPEAFSTEI